MEEEKKVEEQEKKIVNLLDLDVNKHTKKKGRLTYLSWAWAMAEMLKAYPDMTYEVKRNEEGGFLHGNPEMGYFVETSVTAGGITRDMWLPVMDYKNQAILKPDVTSINKNLMRCLTKNFAAWGLGLYIYAGEDLPEGAQAKKASSPADDKLKKLKKEIADKATQLGGTHNKELMQVVAKLGNPNALRSEKACAEYLDALSKVKPVK